MKSYQYKAQGAKSHRRSNITRKAMLAIKNPLYFKKNKKFKSLVEFKLFFLEYVYEYDTL